MQEFLEGSEGSVDVSAYMVRDAELMKWKGYVFDIVTPHSKRCSCFTKSYSKYIRGTGSLLSSNFYDPHTGRCLLDTSDPWSVQELEMMKGLQLRYFTEREVSNIMGFPRGFTFPADTTLPSGSRVAYRALGNSLSVPVVTSLLSYLFRR